MAKFPNGSGIPFGIQAKDNKYKCKDCADRYPGCHDKCESYIQAKEAAREVKKKLNDIYKLDRSLARLHGEGKVTHAKDIKRQREKERKRSK